jgi:hypothetical protein
MIVELYILLSMVLVFGIYIRAVALPHFRNAAKLRAQGRCELCEERLDPARRGRLCETCRTDMGAI